MNREFGQWIPPERCPLPSWPPGSSNTTLETFPRAKTLPRPSPHSLTTLDPRNPATRALDFRQISLNQDQRNVEFGPDTRRRRKSPFHADGPKTWTGQGKTEQQKQYGVNVEKHQHNITKYNNKTVFYLDGLCFISTRTIRSNGKAPQVTTMAWQDRLNPGSMPVNKPASGFRPLHNMTQGFRCAAGSLG